MKNRQQPTNEAAEVYVLGCMILCNPGSRAMDDVATARGMLTPDDFNHPAHRIIFRHLVKMAYSFDIVNLENLRRSLDKSGELPVVGGVEYLVRIVESIPMVGHAREAAAMVRRANVERSIEVPEE